MRLAHKRKVQAKLQKRTKAAVVKAVATPKKRSLSQRKL